MKARISEHIIFHVTYVNCTSSCAGTISKTQDEWHKINMPQGMKRWDLGQNECEASKYHNKMG